MTHRRGLGLALLVLVAMCGGLAVTASCTSPTSCARALAWPLIATVAGGLVAAALGAYVTRCAWLVMTAHRLVGRLGEDPTPFPALTAASSGLRIQRLRVLVSDDPLAFTAGIGRPFVAVSRGLIARVSPDALSAVLAHEAHHAERRDPLRRALRRALADVLVVLPVLHWWAEWSAEREELGADRAALRRASPKAFAEALLATASPGASVALAGFDGAAETRVAQLLGEPMPPNRCSWRVLVASLAGGVGVGAAAVCGAQLAATLSS